jgi:predicted Zn-dependent protease
MASLRSSLKQGVAVALVVSWSQLPALANVDPKKGRVTANPTSGNSYTIEQEVDYGRKTIPEIEKDLLLLPTDHPASKYIDKLGHKLAEKAPGYKFPYTFRVVKQKEINAFALPGGPIYVNIGTIQAGTEAELAGAMGGVFSVRASAAGQALSRKWEFQSALVECSPSIRATPKRKPTWSAPRSFTTPATTRMQC